MTFVVAAVLTLLLSLFLHRTDLGRTIRAAADNSYGALVIGTDVRRVYAVAFGIGAACVGAAGGAVFLSPSLEELVSFSLLILILLVRPAGLFGKRAT